jgi:hypothetical protein
MDLKKLGELADKAWQRWPLLIIMTALLLLGLIYIGDMQTGAVGEAQTVYTQNDSVQNGIKAAYEKLYCEPDNMVYVRQIKAGENQLAINSQKLALINAKSKGLNPFKWLLYGELGVIATIFLVMLFLKCFTDVPFLKMLTAGADGIFDREELTAFMGIVKTVIMVVGFIIGMAILASAIYTG